MGGVFLPRNTRNIRKAEGGDRRRCPRITRRDANGGKGIRKSGPRNTRNTRKGGREVGTAETEGDGVCLTTKYTKRGGRGPEKLPANCAKGREGRRGESEEWPTEYTEYTETGRAEGGIRRRRGESWRESYLRARGRVAGAATCQPAGFKLKGSHESVAAISSFARAAAGSGATGLRAPPGFAVRGLWLAGRWDGSGQQRRRSVGRVFAGFESGAV